MQGDLVQGSDDLVDVLVQADRMGRFQIDSGASGVPLATDQVLLHVRRYAQDLRNRGIGSGDLVMYQGTQSTQAFLLFWASQ